MPSPTDFNQSPYYDDFTESKNFHRILFRPAFAVQARELTQSQSILQNQVERVSDHLFDKGAMVIPGQVAWDTDYQAIKLTSFTGSSTLSDFESVEVTGGTSGVVGTIVNSVVTDGTDPNTLFIRYSKTGTDNAAKTFTDGETITGTTAASVALSAVVETTATGSAAQIEAGVYYINGFHVSVAQQTLILDKYTNTPSYRIGLTVTESFVTPNDDTSLNDNAQGSSNENAPGAHRHKIALTLAKKSLTATDDANFIELLRTKTGTLQQKVNTTAYNVLENTFARRTFDESGDYTISGLDLDVREHLVSGTNRGIYASGETSADGNTAVSTKLALGIGPGKAYVKGYEVQNIGTTYVDVDKPRTFDTQSNFGTNFEVENYVNVTNVYGTPDVGFVSGDTEAYKTISLHDVVTSSRGTAQSTSGAKVPQIGRAKSRGFEYSSGTQSADIMSSSSLTSSVYKHYLFDVEMFVHLNITTAQSFTTGETVTGATSGATGIVESIGSTKSVAITAISAASPGVATAASHTFKDGQQVTIHGTSNFQIDSSVVAEDQVFTVRNPTTNTFELYDGTLGTTAQNVTAYVSGATAAHGVVVLSNVQGSFNNNETITGGTSLATAVTQRAILGSKGSSQRAFHEVKQISMAGSPTYTADTAVSTTALGDIVRLTGTISVANSETAVLGFGSLFQTELKVGDNIAFTTDAGTDLTRVVESIESDSSLQVSTAVGGSDVTTKTSVDRQRTKLQGAENNVSIFRLPYVAIKTLKTTANSNIADTSFKVRRHFTGTLSSSGTLSITAGTNETFSSAAEGDYSVSIMSTGSGSTGAVGDVLSIDGNNHEGDAIFTLAGSPTGVTLTLDYGANFAAHKVKILATVSRTTVSSKTKTLNAASTVTATSQATIEAGTINLGKADIYQLNSVYMSPSFATTPTTSHTDITSRFELDNGQRDNFYDIGRIKLKSGKKTPTGQLLINFDYFSHGAGDFFDVDSYSGVVDYEDIPKYIASANNQVYELRDSLDFRPRVDDASTIEAGGVDRSFDGTGASTVDPVKFKSDVTTDHEYYLPRIDKIFYTKEGFIKVIAGAPSLIPKSPNDLDNAMLLYTIIFPPYGVSTEDVNVVKQDNRRYTMRDIGKIEKRLDNVEYYTQLSLLEQDALGLQIQDANGLDRFKNGFLVDNFSSHRVGDVGNTDYKCSIDMAEGNLRPMFNEDSINLVESTSALSTSVTDTTRAATNYKKTGDLLTLPYSEVTQIEQPFATKTVNVNPFNVLVWTGSLELDPPGDEWKETERRPEVVINNVGAFDTLTQDIPNAELEGVEIGTMFGDWEQNWAGMEEVMLSDEIRGIRLSNGFGGQRDAVRRFQRFGRFETTAETRTNVRNTIVSQTVRNSIGDRIVSVGFVPFIRSRDISFTGTRMKPNTRVYPFFDEVDVSAYVTPTGGSLGGNIVTDASGACSGTFAIPDATNDDNPRWRTGERVLRLTSSSNNSSTNVETSAEADYVARGLIETVQETIISTREPRLVRNEITEQRRRREMIGMTERMRNIDPIAQTFSHQENDGIFITSMDCFFSKKDSTIPITLQIREVVNGYPGQRILPFGEVTLNPSDVNISTDGTTATKFTFPSPVYLEGWVEYCVVLLANSDSYLAYVARMGETVVDGTRTVSTQPSLGSFFMSQNASTWTAEQNEDLKFTLRRAEFENVTGTVYLVNGTLPSRTLATNPITTTDGSDTLTINHRNHGMHSTADNVTIAGIASGTYNGLAHSAINGTHTSISNITHDSYDITLADSTAATSTGDVGGSTVTATQNRQMDTAFLMLQQLLTPGTNVTLNIRTTSGKSLHGSEAQFSLASSDDKVAVVAGRNIFFTAPQMVVSEINETNEMSGSKSFVLIMTLTTSNTKLSPVLDLARSSLVSVMNRLNSPTAVNTTDFVADTAATGGSSSASYITRTATITNPATAFDVRIDANIRGSSEIEVYYRTTGPEDDSRTLETVSWTPFNTAGEEDSLVTPAEDDTTFQEYQYTASDLPEFNAFQLKIVMKGTNSSYPPVIRDLRSIALAV